jgi:hypothetical protein
MQSRIGENDMGCNKNLLRGTLAGATAGASLLVALTGCSPGGVTLGNDWADSKSFVLVKVSNLTTIAGVDPSKASSEPLAAIPTQSDDDGTLASHLVRTPSGQWLITVPRSGGSFSRLYRIGVAEHDLDGLGQVEGSGVLISTKSLVADLVDGSSNSSSALLVYQPGTWKVLRQIQRPQGNLLLAGSDSNETVCTASSTGQASTVDLATGGTTPAVRLSGASPTALACPSGKPLLAGRASAEPGKGIPSFTVRWEGEATLLTASHGRVDQVRASATNGEAVVAVGLADESYLLTVNLASGQITHKVQLPCVYAASRLDELATDGRTWIVADQDKGAIANLSTGTVRSFNLPGSLATS